MNDEKKLSKMIEDFEDYEKYVEEELTMEKEIETFLEKHPISALMEIITKVLIKKEGEAE